MFSSIRSRLLLIGVLIVGSVYFLFPRKITIREPGPNGVMHDVPVTRVPLKRGLDLQGGMHLALELDQSKQVSADPRRDLDLALTVLRKRIDEFGVSEPVIQKVGDERIVVELPGIDDPARAKGIVQRSAFLEFRITDETNALEKAVPAMDRVLRQMGIRGEGAPAGKPSAVEQLLGGDKAAADSAGKDAADSTRKPAPSPSEGSAADSAATPAADSGLALGTGGVLAGLIQPTS